MKTAPDANYGNSALGGNTSGVVRNLGGYDPLGGYGEFLGSYAQPVGSFSNGNTTGDPYLPSGYWDEGYGPVHNISYGAPNSPAPAAPAAPTTPAAPAPAVPNPTNTILSPEVQAGYAAAVQNSFANPLTWYQDANMAMTPEQYATWKSSQTPATGPQTRPTTQPANATNTTVAPTAPGVDTNEVRKKRSPYLPGSFAPAGSGYSSGDFTPGG